MKLFKKCSVEFRPEGIYIFSYRNTPYGMVANLPSIKLPADSSSDQLGEVVLGELGKIELKQFDVNLRSAIDGYKKHLADLGFKSVKAFAKGCAYVSVMVNAEVIEVEPNEAATGGAFVPLPQEKRICSFDKAELGNLILVQRGRCK